ncbi:MAG: ISAs1 family transposase [Planctomycetaceae bacterium]|nr:ISAs1 family transposase [Planctomycetaceae bacterium]
MTSPNHPHDVASLQEIINAFKQLDDPRMVNKNDHLLINIIVIAVCAVIAGADGPTAVGQWAKIHQDNLKLPNGIPSHDTFGRILKRIQPAAFQKCFVEWIVSLRNKNSERREHIAIDGKEIRGSRKNNLGVLHIVSAWSTENGIALGQIAAEEKSNEITAIPELLDQIDVSGCVVTIDAIATQKKIVKKSIDKNADYVIEDRILGENLS